MALFASFSLIRKTTFLHELLSRKMVSAVRELLKIFELYPS